MENRKTVLVVAEPAFTDEGLHRVAFELLGKGRELANALGGSLECLLPAPPAADARELGRHGADQVWHLADERFGLPEECFFKENIAAFIREHRPQIVLFGATQFGRSLAPRVAACLRTGLTADCTDLQIDADGSLIQIRPAFSDNLLAHIKTVTLPQMATVRFKEFRETPRDMAKAFGLTVLPAYAGPDKRISTHLADSERSADIADAEILVAGGRGIKRAEDLTLLRELAEAVGGQVAVSRALVDAGLAPSCLQVGYSGQRVKPRIYIACGISGAPQHLAGMKEAGTIIAINSDPSAPIFRIADYGCVGDLYQAVPALTRAVGGVRKAEVTEK